MWVVAGFVDNFHGPVYNYRSMIITHDGRTTQAKLSARGLIFTRVKITWIAFCTRD